MSDDTQVDDRRSVLEAAFDKMNEDPAPEPVEAAPEVEPVEPAGEPAEEPAKPDRPRDPAGRFAKAEDKPAPAEPKPAKATKPAAAPAPVDPAKPAAAEAKPPEPAAPAAPSVKAPQSWKPAAREAFAKAPPEVQQEVARREAEIARALNETAEARRTVEQVRSTLSPYEGIARANGMDPMQFAGTVLQNAAVLQMGTPAQKAQLVAGIIGAYGIDVDAVNTAMQNPQAPVAPQQHQQPQDVGRMVEQALQQRIHAAQQSRANTAWQEFQASAPEFLADVQGDMAEILELAGRQGRNMTFQQAYDRACKLNEDVASILAQRKAAADATARNAATQKAKAAASSVKPSQAAAVGAAQPTDRRELLSRRYDELAEK
jgi:hypothetical protein